MTQSSTAERICPKSEDGLDKPPGRGITCGCSGPSRRVSCLLIESHRGAGHRSERSALVLELSALGLERSAHVLELSDLGLERSAHVLELSAFVVERIALVLELSALVVEQNMAFIRRCPRKIGGFEEASQAGRPAGR